MVQSDLCSSLPACWRNIFAATGPLAACSKQKVLNAHAKWQSFRIWVFRTLGATVGSSGDYWPDWETCNCGHHHKWHDHVAAAGCFPTAIRMHVMVLLLQSCTAQVRLLWPSRCFRELFYVASKMHVLVASRWILYLEASPQQSVLRRVSLGQLLTQCGTNIFQSDEFQNVLIRTLGTRLQQQWPYLSTSSEKRGCIGFQRISIRVLYTW